MGLQINLGLQQQLIVLVVSLPLGLHPSPLGGFVLFHLSLRTSLGPLVCNWPVSGFSSHMVGAFLQNRVTLTGLPMISVSESDLTYPL